MTHQRCKKTAMMKNDESNPPTSINDLNDEMLLEILRRVDCYATALRWKTVSKFWCSIVSDPSFVALGLFARHRDIITNDKDQPRTFLLTMKRWDENIVTAVVTPPSSQRLLRVQFFPFPYKVIATFRDVTLCCGVNPVTGEAVFNICNLVTKEWLPLPPSPTHREVIWAALVCQKGRGFRVVVAQSFLVSPNNIERLIKITLLIYVSETRQWKNIDVVMEANLSVTYYRRSFTGVVCNGMVFVHCDIYFGAFDPFDVTDTFHGTLTAIALPLPIGELDMLFRRSPEVLLESCGKLIAIESKYLILRSDLKTNYIVCAQTTHIWKLHPRPENYQEPFEWELISRLHGCIEVKGAVSLTVGKNEFKFVGVHPNKEHLMYLLSISGNQLVLCNTKSKVLELLMVPLPPHQLVTSYKLDFPSWPVPLKAFLEV